MKFFFSFEKRVVFFQRLKGKKASRMFAERLTKKFCFVISNRNLRGCKAYFSMRVCEDLGSLDKVLIEVPNYSSISIGGYADHTVPKHLLSALCKANCQHLTLITNNSICDNIDLRRMISIENKIDVLHTSLDANRDVLNFEKQLPTRRMYSNKKFLEKFCHHGIFEDINSNDHYDYAFVKAEKVDQSGTPIQIFCFFVLILAKLSPNF
jgi:hypothetical protein